MKVSHLMVNFTVTQCINFILNKNTSPTDFIVVTSNSVEILPNRPVARFEKGKRFIIPLGLKPDVLIFDNVTYTELLTVYYTLVQQQAYNTTAKYIFIVDIPYTAFEYFVYFVGLNYFVNTIFINMRTRKIIAMAPYEDFKYEHLYSKLLIELGSCDDQSSLGQNFFPSKNYRNWRKRTITLTYIPQEVYTVCGECKNPGISIEIITLILKYLNIPYTFLVATYENMAKIVVNQDFVAGGLILQPSGEFEYTKPYAEDAVYFYLARSPQIDRWRYILLVFSPSAWMYFVLSLLATVAVFALMKFIDKRIRNIGIIQFIFIIFLGRIARYRTKVVSLEILVFCMIFISVMLNYLFCSKLTYLLNGITFEKGVESFADIAKQGLTIGVSHKSYMNWVKSLPEFRHYTEKNFVICSKNFTCDWKARRYRNLTFIAGYRYMSKFQKVSFDKKTGIPYLKYLKPRLSTIKSVSGVRKGHPLLPILNKYLQYLIDSGITETIIKKYETPEDAVPTLEPTESLKLRHFVAPFMILAVGLTASFFTFLIEVRNEKYSPRRKTRAWISN
ncbi:hypothetical protein WA026_018444 [Henosepilachna vigintioctopunctata]|uniref:Uncharacterized protein n=1 Tax=Henosepilachna vigintioctopunctata TaxID=420089 RepID=A0AAW1V221_9CUCU